MILRAFLGLLLLTLTAIPINAFARSTSRPNYIYSENGVYFYAAAITPKQRNAGQIAGDAVGYRYYGQNKAGEYVLVRVSGDGSIESFVYCKNPCRVIRTSTSERFVNNSRLVVSSAFMDAFRGRMRNTNPSTQKSHVNIPSRSPIDANSVTEITKRADGITIPASSDAPIRATADGIVRFAGKLDTHGNTITIDHGGKIQTLYGNLATIAVKPKDAVKKGQLIGIAGKSKSGTGYELIYEIWIEGNAVDPLTYMRDGDAELQALFQSWKTLKEK